MYDNRIYFVIGSVENDVNKYGREYVCARTTPYNQTYRNSGNYLGTNKFGNIQIEAYKF